MVVTCLYVDRKEGTGAAGLLAFLPISESNPKFEDRLQSGQDGMREWTSKNRITPDYLQVNVQECICPREFQGHH